MKTNKLRIAAYSMLAIALIFIDIAFGNPEFSFPWSNTISYIIYAVYIAVMIFLFIISGKK